MAVMKITKNMGKTDRIVRGLLGGLMLLDGLYNYDGDSPARIIEAGVGGAFLIYGLTGFDPLLKVYGASTIPGAEDNILHQLKQMAPGKGINPMLTQQAVPQKKSHNNGKEKSLADFLSIK